MDGDTTTTSSKAKASIYLIGPNADGTRYWVKLPETPREKDVDGWMRMRDALRENNKLKAYLMPWLIRNRPYHEWEERIARQPKRPRAVISESAEFPLPRSKPSTAGLTG